EKRESFKRRGSIISSSSNRRWFTIEEFKEGELALCYYKRPSDDEKGGFIFLSDVIAINQDHQTNFITIHHPSRILRIQSPTPAQHRVWFSTLSKCCTNVSKEVASPASPYRGDRRPSLPYFQNAVSPVRRNSADPVPSTPKDQLKFLREITGGDDAGSDKENRPKKLFEIDLVSTPCSSRSSRSGNLSIQEDKHAAAKATPRSIASPQQPDFPDLKQTTSRIHQYIKNPTRDEVRTELAGGKFDDVCSFHDSSMDSSDLSEDGANCAPAKKQLLLAATKLKGAEKDNFDLTSIKLAFDNTSDELLKGTDTSESTAFHVSTSFTNSSFTKKSQSFTGYSRSSSYQKCFENDDEVLKPDDNFATDDWDE
ncbi:hypothetical protein ACHAWO_000291, partial [Cyclotella atomus]